MSSVEIDPNTECPECGGAVLDARFHDGSRIGGLRHCGFGDVTKAADEHIHVYCKSCAFDWVVEDEESSPAQGRVRRAAQRGGTAGPRSTSLSNLVDQ